MVRSPVDHSRLAAALVLILFVMTIAPVATAGQSRATGVDLTPTGFSTQFVDSGDRSEFGLLSRATPPTHPTRSPDLWVIDGLVGKALRISGTVRNDGDTAATAFDLRFVVIHDEYGTFEILNATSTFSSLAAGSSNTASTTWTPTYSGNHTLLIETVSSQDAYPGNDRLTNTVTIGAMYETAESGTTWTRGNGWNIDSTHSLGGSASFKVGTTGTSGQYSNLWTTSVTSPTMDLSDAHPAPNSGIGVGFFYTGATEANDRMMLQLVSSGNVHDLMGNGGLSGTVNGQPNQWLININSVGGRAVPWYPLDPATLSSTSQFRFLFTSDASGTDLGYWVDDVVMFYDQKAAADEFSLTASGAAQASAPRSGWGDLTFSVRNDGNVTDRVTFSSEGLPNDWNVQFANPSGSGLVAGTEIELQPGETRAFVLKFQPPESAETGSEQGTIRIASVLETSAVASHGFTATVDPRYTPEWASDLPTHRCAPGRTCTFDVQLSNGGDGSDTFVLSASPELLPDGWSFGLSSEQPSSVTLQPGEVSDVRMAVAVPADAPSGTDARCRLIAESQADSTSVVETTVNVTASMISAATVVLDESSLPADGVLGVGEHVDLIYIVSNEANRQDIYTVSLDGLTGTAWGVEVLGVPTLSVGSNETGIVRVRLTAPSDGLANDPATRFEVVLASSQSGSEFRSEQFEGIRVRMLHDLSTTLMAEPTIWTPGVADAIRLNVTNQGNGDDQVNVVVSGLPNGWNWSIRVDGVASSLPFPIGLAPDADSIRTVEIVIDPSGTASPGTTVETTITVSPAIGVDIDADDDVVTSRVKVKSVPLAEMDGFPVQSRTGILLGSTSFEEITIRNEGNKYDSNLQVRLRMDPMMPDLEAAIIVDGVEHGLTSWVGIPLSPQTDVLVVTRVQIGKSVPLGTEVTLTVDVRRDGDPEPIALTSSITYTADEERVIEADPGLEAELTASLATSGAFQVEVTSRSTRDEQVHLRTTAPTGWTISCTPTNGRGDAYRLILEPDSPDGRTLPFDCEYVIGEGADDGNVLLELHDADGIVLWTSSHSVTLERPDPIDEEPLLAGGSSTALAAGGLVALLATAAILFTLIMRRRRSLHEEPEESYDDDPVPMDGHHGAVAVDHAHHQAVTATPAAHDLHHHTPHHASAPQHQQPASHATTLTHPQHAVQTVETHSAHLQPAAEHGMVWDGHRWVAPHQHTAPTPQQTDPVQTIHQASDPAYPAHHGEAPAQQPLDAHAVQGAATTVPYASTQTPGDEGNTLHGAFASLGVTQADGDDVGVSEALDATAEAPAAEEAAIQHASSHADVVPPVTEHRTEDPAGVAAAEGATVPAASTEGVVPEGVVPEAEGGSAAAPLPIIACTHCNHPLGPTDVWSECVGCGGYRHEACLASSPTCPRCHSS